MATATSSWHGGRTPAIWYSDAGGFMLDPTGTAMGEVMSISQDGSFLSGNWNTDGFYWTADAGVVDIGHLDGGTGEAIYTFGIALQGQVILGDSANNSIGTSTPVYWTQANGFRRLEDLLPTYGISEPAGQHIFDVKGCSEDGTVIVGDFNDGTGLLRTYVLKLPAGALLQ
jgi:hypothetical protein